MTIRTRPALGSLLVNTALFAALLSGLTLPPDTRAETPSTTPLANNYAAHAGTVARVNDASLSAYHRRQTGPTPARIATR